MGKTITSRYPFSGKNQVCVVAEEIAVTTALPVYGKNRTENINPAGTTPNGSYTWKNMGYVTGGQTTESRTMEEVVSIGRRNVQQLAETKFECGGSLDIEYQNGRPLYLTVAANNGIGTPAQTAPGIAHTDDVGSVTGLNRHIIYEPEIVSGGITDNAVPDPPSFNLIDGYTIAGNSQPKVVRKYVGCKVDTLSMNFTKDNIIKLSMAWKGAQVYASQATTVANLFLGDFLSYEEVFPPVFGKVYLQAWTYPLTAPTWTTALDSALAAVGNQMGDVQASSFTISNSLEPLFVIGDVTARAMPAQARKYEGRLSIAFTDEAQHVRFLGEFNNTYVADPSGGADYGVGTWTYPWYAADRQKYYALKLFYDNASLGYTSASASYRRIEVTLLGVKFKSMSAPRQANGIIYQDFDYTAMMLAPYNSSDNVGGIVLYDAIPKATFHSTATGIA